MNLSNITLVGITNKEKYQDTIRAIKFSCKDILFGQVKIICNEKIENSDDIIHEHSELLNTAAGYGKFCVNHLKEFINTDFCLLVQWDGFVINSNLWQDRFLEYDYIGAPWDHPISRNKVGNGGFSLRSKRFLEVSSELTINTDSCEWLYDWQKDFRDVTPEDWFICYENYDYMIKNNIKFPNAKLASCFSVEYPIPCHRFDKNDINTYKSFGFHGHFNTAAMNLL